MDERRKNRRIELESKLMIKRLGGADVNQEVNIDILDVSKTGMGFNCKTPLEIGAVYETYLTIWTKETIHAFIEIVRIVKEGDNFIYGAIFIGMSEMDAARIAVYDTISSSTEE